MELVTPEQLEVGDVVEGPDGPELIKGIEGRIIFFKNKNHCMTIISQREKVVRHVSGKTLRDAGVSV